MGFATAVGQSLEIKWKRKDCQIPGGARGVMVIA